MLSERADLLHYRIDVVGRRVRHCVPLPVLRVILLFGTVLSRRTGKAQRTRHTSEKMAAQSGEPPQG